MAAWSCGPETIPLDREHQDQGRLTVRDRPVRRSDGGERGANPRHAPVGHQLEVQPDDAVDAYTRRPLRAVGVRYGHVHGGLVIARDAGGQKGADPVESRHS